MQLTRTSELILACAIGAAFSTKAHSDTSVQEKLIKPLVFFEVKPNRCIALRKGQDCYQTLKFKWDLDSSKIDQNEEATFCLVQDDQDNPLICWQKNELNNFKIEFKSSSGVEYFIVRKDKNEKLGRLEVDVSWVYKNKKSRVGSWRLF